jgi:hypothetical protein
MQLHPEITKAQALSWLEQQVEALNLDSPPEDLGEALESTAAAMAAISRTTLPDDLEPMFP